MLFSLILKMSCKIMTGIVISSLPKEKKSLSNIKYLPKVN